MDDVNRRVGPNGPCRQRRIRSICEQAARTDGSSAHRLHRCTDSSQTKDCFVPQIDSHTVRLQWPIGSTITAERCCPRCCGTVVSRAIRSAGRSELPSRPCPLPDSEAPLPDSEAATSDYQPSAADSKRSAGVGIACGGGTTRNAHHRAGLARSAGYLPLTAGRAGRRDHNPAAHNRRGRLIVPTTAAGRRRECRDTSGIECSGPGLQARLRNGDGRPGGPYAVHRRPWLSSPCPVSSIRYGVR